MSGAIASVYSVDAVSSATEFDDYRRSGTLGLGFSGRRAGLTLSGTFGTESDYLSIAMSAAANIDLPGKNTKLAAGERQDDGSLDIGPDAGDGPSAVL